MKHFCFTVVFGVITLLPSFSQDLPSHFFTTSLENAGPPRYHSESDSIVFTYEAENTRIQPRYVGIAFEHENFVPVHELGYIDNKDNDGTFVSRVYYYFLPIDEKIENFSAVHYRYVVDGIWIEDPLNFLSIKKFSTRKISVAEIPVERAILPRSPFIIDGDAQAKVVQFIYHADPGEEIFLAGSFNNWDPFVYLLSENLTTPGRYEIKIRLLPGSYQYNYYYRGRRVKDPLNIQSSYDIEGYEYSFFSIKS